MTNLLHNAIKYGEGKPVRVSLEADGGVATLTVEDHGIGIPAADQRRIFERFERAVSARQYGGMGIGLFIVDQILKAHEGEIEVHSEPGRGATFVVRLPRAPGPRARVHRMHEVARALVVRDRADRKDRGKVGRHEPPRHARCGARGADP